MVLDGTSRSTDGNGGSETANGYGPGDGRQAGVGSEGVNEAEVRRGAMYAQPQCIGSGIEDCVFRRRQEEL